jgi:hypothetical protein
MDQIDQIDQIDHVDTNNQINHVDTNNQINHVDTNNQINHVDTNNQINHVDTSDQIDYVDTNNQINHADTSEEDENMESSNLLATLNGSMESIPTTNIGDNSNNNLNDLDFVTNFLLGTHLSQPISAINSTNYSNLYADQQLLSRDWRDIIYFDEDEVDQNASVRIRTRPRPTNYNTSNYNNFSNRQTVVNTFNNNLDNDSSDDENFNNLENLVVTIYGYQYRIIYSNYYEKYIYVPITSNTIRSPCNRRYLR